MTPRIDSNIGKGRHLYKFPVSIKIICEWKDRGARTTSEYAILINEIMQGAFDLRVDEVHTREYFAQPDVNDRRNPNLAEAMRHLGYAQHFGAGIQIARETLVRNGNPPPEFKFDLGPVMAIIRKQE